MCAKQLIKDFGYDLYISAEECVQVGKMFRMSNLGVYLYHETMTAASLWIAVIVKYRNGECIIPSKIVNVNISETF